MNMERIITEEEVVELLQYFVDVYLSEFAMRASVSTEMLVTDALGGMAIAIRQKVFGRKLKEITCEWPADWWQAFRARWFPRWWLRRWPVRYERRQLVAHELYPELKMPDDHPMVMEIRRG